MYYIILLINALYSGTLHGTRPIISLFANMQGASPFVIGLLVSCYALLPMLLAVMIGKWLDRYGSRTMIYVGVCGIMIAMLLPILFPNVITLFFTQILTGFSQPFILLSFQKTIGNWPGNRDKQIAALSLTASLGELGGPLLTGFTFEHFGFRAAMALSFTIILLTFLFGLLIKPSSWENGASPAKNNRQPAESPWAMLKQRNLLKALIISGLVLYSKDLYVAFFPVYASNIGFSAGTIGVILSIMGGMSMAVRLWQFQLVQSFGRGVVLTTTLIVSGACYILVPATGNVILLAILTGFLGSGLGLGQPLSIVYAMDLTPQDRHGQVLGVRITFNRVSQFVAPFLLGGIGGVAGVVPVFWISGGILLFGAYFTRIKTALPEEIPESLSQS